MTDMAAENEPGPIGLINSYAQINQLSEVKLNLGSGGRPLKGWINIDNYDYEGGDTSRSGSEYDIKMDIRQLDAFDLGYEEHPFMKTRLGLFFHHLKGPARKLQGHS